jgi:hypothetical protein
MRQRYARKSLPSGTRELRGARGPISDTIFIRPHPTHPASESDLGITGYRNAANAAAVIRRVGWDVGPTAAEIDAHRRARNELAQGYLERRCLMKRLKISDSRIAPLAGWWERKII